MNKEELREYRFNTFQHVQNIIKLGECRCAIINKKVKKLTIDKIVSDFGISRYHAETKYNEIYLDEFHSCCAICCSCHWEQHAEKTRWG